jgi:hypothetical protein
MESSTLSARNATERISPAASTAMMLVENFGAEVVKTYGVDEFGVCFCRDGIDCGTPGKHPVGAGGYHNATSNIHSILSSPPNCNWSLSTGFPLVGLDDDTDNNTGLDAVEAEIGSRLPASSTIRTGSNHLTRIFRTPERVSRLVPMLKTSHGNVDFLGYPLMTVLPGSRSGSGEYSWERGLSPPEVGFADIPAAVVQLVNSKRERGGETQNCKPGDNATQKIPVFQGSVFQGMTDLERLIRRCIPDQAGMRWHSLFRLARGLKALPEFAEASQKQLEPVLVEWHRRSLRFIRTKDIQVSRRDLWEGYRRVKFAGGINGRLAAMVNPDFGSAPLPIRLERLCGELQLAAGNDPFFLACRSAAEVLGANYITISRILKDMRTDGLLELVQQGKRRRAAEYLYRGGGE